MSDTNRIPEEHLKVLNETDLVLQQFADFMNGENASLIIRNEAEYANAAQVIAAVKKHKKLVENSKEEVCQPLHAAWKSAIAEFTPSIEKITEKVCALESAGRQYRQRVEAEARRQQAIVDQKAADERRKAEEKAEAERKKAEAYREQGKKSLAEKADLRADNQNMKATSIVAPIITAPITPSFRGSFNTQKRWAGRIVKIEQLLEHFKGNCPPDVEKAALTWVCAQARASKGAKSTIPGTEFYEI